MQAFIQRWADGKDIYSLLKASHWGIKFKTLHYQPSAQNNSWTRIAKVPIFSDIYSHSATFNFQLIQAIKNHVLHSSEHHAPPVCQVDCFTVINVTQLFQERKIDLSDWNRRGQVGDSVTYAPSFTRANERLPDRQPCAWHLLLLLPVAAQASPAHLYFSNLFLLRCLCAHPSYWMSFQRAIQEPAPHPWRSRRFPSMRCNEMIYILLSILLHIPRC